MFFHRSGFNRIINSFKKYPYLIIIVLSLVVYGQVIYFDYSYNDDDIMILHNNRIAKESLNLKTAFTTDAWFRNKEIELYRPMQSLSYMLDFIIGKKKPYIYHTTNLLLHIISCCLFFYLLRLLSYSEILALLGSLVLAVHYAFLHTVCWIPARGDLLMAVFALISSISLIKISENRNILYSIIHFSAFFLALLSKESAIFLILIYLLLNILILKQKIITRRSLLSISIYVVLLFSYLYLRNNAISRTASSFGIHAFVKNLPILPESLLKFLFPVNFSVMPHFKPLSTFLGVLVLLFFLYWFFRKNFPISKFLLGGSLFILLTLPAMFYRPEFSDYAYEYLDHRIYLPGIGLIIMLLEIIIFLNMTGKRYFKMLVCIILVVSSTVTIVLSRSYKSPMNYYNQAIRSNPGSALAYANRGNIFKDRNEPAKAIIDYSKAIELKPDFYQAYRNRGQLFETLNNYNSAFIDLKKADSFKPNQPEVLFPLAVACNNLKDFNAALGYLNILINLNKTNAVAYLQRGNTFKNMKDFKAALNDYTSSILLDPQLNEARLSRGVLLGGLARYQESISDLSVYLSRVSNNGYAFYFRGIANLELKKLEEACNDLNKAKVLGVEKAQNYIRKFCIK